MPENIEAVGLFLASNTQWQYSGMGSRTGLNYQGVETVARIHEITLDSELFGKIQILERAVIIVDQEKHAREN